MASDSRTQEQIHQKNVGLFAKLLSPRDFEEGRDRSPIKALAKIVQASAIALTLASPAMAHNVDSTSFDEDSLKQAVSAVLERLPQMSQDNAVDRGLDAIKQLLGGNQRLTVLHAKDDVLTDWQKQARDGYLAVKDEMSLESVSPEKQMELSERLKAFGKVLDTPEDEFTPETLSELNALMAPQGETASTEGLTDWQEYILASKTEINRLIMGLVDGGDASPEILEREKRRLGELDKLLVLENPTPEDHANLNVLVGGLFLPDEQAEERRVDLAVEDCVSLKEASHAGDQARLHRLAKRRANYVPVSSPYEAEMGMDTARRILKDEGRDEVMKWVHRTNSLVAPTAIHLALEEQDKGLLEERSKPSIFTPQKPLMGEIAKMLQDCEREIRSAPASSVGKASTEVRAAQSVGADLARRIEAKMAARAAQEPTVPQPQGQEVSVPDEDETYEPMTPKGP